MTDIAELGIRVDARQVRQGGEALDDFARRGARAEQSAESFRGVVASLGKGLAALGLIAKAVDLGASVINAQRDFDKLNASLITATGSVGNASQAFAALQRFAATTPYSLQEVSDGFIKLRNLGLTPSERALESYGNTAAAMGKSLNQFIEAVADASTSEFERLKEFGIKAKQNGDQVALTFQGVTTTIGNNAREIEGYLMALGETKFAGGMELQANSLDGAISNLADTWDMTLLTFAQSGFGDVAMGAVLGLSGALTDLQAILRAVTGEADKEKAKIQELGPVHKALTTIFETVSVLGANVAYVFTTIGKDIGAFAAAVVAAAQGDFKLVLQIATQRKQDAEQERKEIDARTAAILGAADAARAVREQEKEEKDREQRDDLARYAVKASGVKEVSAAQKKAAEEATKWAQKTIEAGNIEIALLTAERDAMGELTPVQRDGIKLRAEMQKYAALLAPAQKKVIEGQQAEREALEAVNLEREQYLKLMGEQLDASRNETAGADDRVKQLEDEVKYFGMAEVAVLRLKLAELQLEQQRAGNDVVQQDRLFRLIAATEDQIAAQTKLDKMKATASFWTSLESTAHQTFVSIMDGSKNAAQRLKDTFKNIFFDWLYQQTLKKWIVQLSPEVAGGGGGLSSFVSTVGSAFSGGSSSGSTWDSASSLLSAGKMIYQGFTGGMAASMGGYITQFGNLFGSQAISAFGTGMGLTGAQAGTAASAYAASGNAAAAGGLTSGASAASALPIIGWIIAGMMSSNALYKQGWDFNNGSVNKLGQNLGSGINLVDQLARKLGFSDSTANIISGLAPVSKLFGRRNPTIEEQGLTGTVSASGFSGGTYADILEKGGIFRSDKRYTVTGALTADQDAGFDGTIAAMITAVKGFGDVLGAETSAIDGYSKAIKLVLTNDEEKNKELIAAMFSGIADDLSLILLPSVTKFAVEGETASTTLQRLATDFANVTTLLQAIGVTSQQAFGAVGVSTIEARERLIALAGGIDALVSQTDYFAQNFLTDAERFAPVQKALTEQMAALGYAGVTTNEQFKAAVMGLVTSGALATEAGAKTYAGLLAIAPQFKTVADYMQQIADIELQNLAENAAALSAFADTALDALSRAVGKQKDVVQAAYEESLAALEASIDGVSGSISNLSELSSLLGTALNGMTMQGQEAVNRASAQAQIESSLAIAKAGGALPTAESIRQAVATASATSTEGFASFLDYQRDFVRTSSALAELAALTDGQMSDAQRQLALLQGQRDDLKVAAEKELARLDGLLEAAQAQIDAVNGVNNSVLSVTAALAQMAAAIAGLKAGATPSNPGGAGMTVEGLYQSVLGRSGDAAGLAFWTSAFGDSVDPSEMSEFLKAAAPELAAKDAGTWQQWLHDKGIPGYAAGGSHGGGWRVVGENGPELEATGPSRILSNSASTSLMAGVEKRLQSLEAVMATGLSRLIGETKRGADNIETINDKGVKARDEEEIS